jgi:hypothetical protein
MTIKSIDMQVLVQKVGDVARIQQAQQIGHNHRQEEFVKNISQETDKYSKTVNKPGESQHKKVDEKEEKEKQSGKGYKDGGKQDHEEPEDKKKPAPSGSGGKLDIIV